MNIAVALSLLAVICTTCAEEKDDRSKLDKLRLQIRDNLDSVENDLLELDAIRRESEDVTSDKVIDEGRKQEKVFRKFVDLSVNQMRKELKTAEEKDVDAQHCFDANYEGVKGVVKKADEDSRKCKESSYETLKENLQFIDDVKKRGDMLKDDLRGIELHCHSGDTKEMIICLTTELAKIEENVKNFKDDVVKTKQAVDSVGDFVLLEARKCFENIYDEALFNCEAARRSHTGCVNKAIETAGKTRRISPKIIQ
ncbi:uncharacterized protein LOC109860370 [Pseudomyrmex gracilis]|uniref:uncharacterized protein LOC109860370 n=1 Tax=Pseudomyrmex gracilis TaxID=219809 RepID=UPI000995D7C4|nr:uncharacterized protein LOC109860370 [Pseudomyrmex gracilis]